MFTQSISPQVIKMNWIHIAGNYVLYLAFWYRECCLYTPHKIHLPYPSELFRIARPWSPGNCRDVFERLTGWISCCPNNSSSSFQIAHCCFSMCLSRAGKMWRQSMVVIKSELCTCIYGVSYIYIYMYICTSRYCVVCACGQLYILHIFSATIDFVRKSW